MYNRVFGTKEIVCWTLYNEAEYLNLTVDELKARIEEFEATHTYLSLTPHDFSLQLAYDNFQSYSCENDIAEEYKVLERVHGPNNGAMIRKATEEWLENNFLHPDILLMRPAKSFIAGPVCKKKLYEDKFYIPFVLEDNAKCGAMKA